MSGENSPLVKESSEDVARVSQKEKRFRRITIMSFGAHRKMGWGRRGRRRNVLEAGNLMCCVPTRVRVWVCIAHVGYNVGCTPRPNDTSNNRENLE
jgi:hypothetical protein